VLGYFNNTNLSSRSEKLIVFYFRQEMGAAAKLPRFLR